MGMEVSISMLKSSIVCGEGFSAGFRDEDGSDVDKKIDSTAKTKEELPFFLAALGIF